MNKLRVLTISKPYVAAAYRQKFRYLAEDPRFEIGLITPKNWAGQDYEALAGEKYWQRSLDIAFNGKNHFHYYRSLSRAMAEFAPDIVNIEEEHYSFVTFQAIREARKLGAKSIFYSWQNIDKNYPPPFSWIENYVFQHSNFALTGNQEALCIIKKKGFQKKGEVLPQMGADADAIEKARSGRQRFRLETEAKLNLVDNPLVLIFAGRFVEEKGIQDVIRALALINRQTSGSKTNIHLLLLGNGPYIQNLLNLANIENLTAQVHLIGSVSSLEIYNYIGIADALVLPSHTRKNWKEQFGRVLVEAMQSGTVPIGSDSGEIPLVIADAGLVHKEQDISDIARCILSLADDREFLKSLSIAGIARASLHYTNAIIANKTAQIYLDVAATDRD